MQIKSLKEICSLITKGTTPTSLGMKLNEGEINFIKVECLSEDGNIISSKMQKIDETTHNKLNRSKLHEGDILYSIAGSIGRMTVVDSSILPANTNQAVAILRPIKELIDTQYLFYFLKDTKSQKNAMRRIVQSVQTNLSLGELSSLEVAIPSLPMQIAIGNFMNSLDAKIASNNALSKTLEDIAQTIFKSWFIDFDPVKAKMAGEKPAGMDAATAALFPDSMEESELGLIPRGWEFRPIGDELEVSGGTTPSTTKPEFWDGEHCWTTPKDLSKQSGLITTSSERRITEAGLNQISSGLLPIHSVLMSCRAPIGYVSINAIPTAVNQGFITLRNSAKYSPLYLVNWLLANMQEIKNRAGGATFAEISRKSFREIPFLVPSIEVLAKFSELTVPTVLQFQQLALQNEKLVAARDSLLPRLISGELQIPKEMLAS